MCQWRNKKSDCFLILVVNNRRGSGKKREAKPFFPLFLFSNRSCWLTDGFSQIFAFVRKTVYFIFFWGKKCWRGRGKAVTLRTHTHWKKRPLDFAVSLLFCSSAGGSIVSSIDGQRIKFYRHLVPVFYQHRIQKFSCPQVLARLTPLPSSFLHTKMLSLFFTLGLCLLCFVFRGFTRRLLLFLLLLLLLLLLLRALLERMRFSRKKRSRIDNKSENNEGPPPPPLPPSSSVCYCCCCCCCYCCCCCCCCCRWSALSSAACWKKISFFSLKCAIMLLLLLGGERENDITQSPTKTWCLSTKHSTTTLSCHSSSYYYYYWGSQ